MSKSIASEAEEICGILRQNLPHKWDGKTCVLELRKANYQWRQMEWIGWYFEYKAISLLYAVFGSHPGPTFGSTKFDFKLNFVWDFKAHPMKTSTQRWIIVNDKEAIDDCLETFGGLGIVIAEGEAEYDDNIESFKSWHDSLKAKRSSYEDERIRRGAPSRRRKTAFYLSKLEALWFDREILSSAKDEGSIVSFQEGMRNADGSARRPKYMMNLEKIPYEARLASI